MRLHPDALASALKRMTPDAGPSTKRSRMTPRLDAAAMQCNRDERIAAGIGGDLTKEIGINALGNALMQAPARGTA